MCKDMWYCCACKSGWYYVALEEFKTLQARLNEIDEPLDSFDPKLFEEVIKGMTVNNRDDMTFRLIGDLTFTVRL